MFVHLKRKRQPPAADEPHPSVFNKDGVEELLHKLRRGGARVCVVCPTGAGATFTVKKAASVLGLPITCMYQLAERFPGKKWRDLHVHDAPCSLAVADPFIPSGQAEIKSMGEFMRLSRVPVCVVTNEERVAKALAECGNIAVVRMRRDPEKVVASKLVALFHPEAPKDDAGRARRAAAVAKARRAAAVSGGNLTHAVTQMSFATRFPGYEPDALEGPPPPRPSDAALISKAERLSSIEDALAFSHRRSDADLLDRRVPAALLDALTPLL